MVHTLNIDKVQDGENLNLRYNKADYNAAIHKAAVALHAVLADGAVEMAAAQLDLQFGRDVLSNQYSKLQRLVSEANKAANSQRSASQVAAWLIQMLTLAVQTRKVAPNKATEQWLYQNRHTGAMGFWPACFLVMEADVDPRSQGFVIALNLIACLGQVFDHAKKLSSQLQEPEATKFSGLLDEMLDPQTCWSSNAQMCLSPTWLP